MLKAAFIGAGRRANSAHYPALERAGEAVALEAVCDLDPDRLTETADRYDVERRYTDLHRMLDEVDCDVVYVVMQPELLPPVAVAALDAGRHVFVEKPPGASSAATERIAAAARRNDRLVCVGLQRRWTPMIRTVLAKVRERGPIRCVLTEFHKNLIDSERGRLFNTRLYDEDIHMIDFIRWVCGGAWEQVLTRSERSYTDWPSTYNSIVRFRSGTVAVHTVVGHAAQRYYRIGLHGNAVSAYLRPPAYAEIFTADAEEPEIIRGQPIPGHPEGRLDEGLDALHRDFLDCVATGRQPLTNIHDVLQSMRLLEEIGELDANGRPRT